MSEYIIETKGLKKKFGDFAAVKGIDLKVKKGEVYGFLGPNGAGKSTTIRMILGLIKPSGGDVTVFGKSISKNPMDILKRVGSMVEAPSYYGNLTAKENLEITRRILGTGTKNLDEVLRIVNLYDNKDKKVKKFSLGMKQRLGIAQALLGNRELLILDEPTNGLDPSGIHEIRDLIISLPERLGVTVLVSSHILSEIELMAKEVGIINEGRLLYQGTMEELRESHKPKICIKAAPIVEAGNFLMEKGYPVQKKDDFLYLDSKWNIEDINKELVFKGFGVSHLSHTSESLEEIFLQMTGDDVK